jgi:hypothetical protein
MMRQGSNHRRMRGRGGNGKQRHMMSPRSQTFDSNGPSGRIRGNAYQVYERYLALARDAQASGDRITAENYFQHAEHYFRIIAAANEAQMRNGGQPQQPRPYDGNGQPVAPDGGNNQQPPGLQEQPAEGEFEDAEQFPNT